MEIRFYKNDEIDKKEWDDIIRSSISPLIYVESIFLDHMAPGWGALVSDDKMAVMPVPLKRKFGISYVFQPPFTQQLGIFSLRKLTDSEKIDFLRLLSRKVKVVDLYLNYQNRLPGLKKRSNSIIDLNRTFAEISDGFRNDLARKGVKNQLRYVSCTLVEVFGLYRKFVFPKVNNLDEKILSNFENLCRIYAQRKRIVSRKVISDSGDTLAACACLADNRRIYGNLGASSDDGRKVDANAFLLYHLIAEFSGKPLVFDFEGSEIPGVAFFFKKFGPVEQSYYEYKSNRLGPILKAGLAFRDRLRSKK